MTRSIGNGPPSGAPTRIPTADGKPVAARARQDHDPALGARAECFSAALHKRQPQDLSGTAATAGANTRPVDGPAQPVGSTAEPTGKPRPAGADSIDPAVSTTPTPTLGDAILRGLHGAPQPPAAAPPATAQAKQVNALVQKIAAQVLVADAASGAPQVRITLNDSFLAGSEVQIRRQDGRVIIDFVVTSNDAQHRLEHHTSELQTVLKERLRDEVSVNVRTADSARDSAADGQPQDGRSRQRRSLPDAWEAEQR